MIEDREKFREEIVAHYLKEHEELGEAGTLRQLEEGRQWDLTATLNAGGVIVFPHVGVADCGQHVAATVHACLDSGADRVRLALRQDNGWLRIEIRDRGRGFDPQAVPASCYGLRGAQHRARVFGGGVRIDSRPGGGTRILVDLPIDPDDQEDSLG